MDLTNVMDEMRNLVAENVSLKQEKEKKQDELIGIMQKNYKKIFELPFSQLEDLDALLYKTTDYGFTLLQDDNGFAYRPACYSNSGLQYLSHTISMSDNRFCKSDVIRYFSELFSSTEATIRTLDKVKKHFALRFEEYRRILERKNSDLKYEVEKLCAELKDAQTVIHNTDGTIELNIDGKVYVGTIKEIKNV